MPFDPNLPTEGTSTDAALMRAQLNALNDKIEAQAAQIAALETALDSRATKPTMGEFDPGFSDPPTLADLQNIQTVFNDLIVQLESS